MKLPIIAMLELQDAMNSKVHPQWREQGNAWYRAIWVECAELLDHYGWKWWKAQQPDMEQVELEVIDIWHFGLSIELESGDDNAVIAERLSKTLSKRADEGLRETVESFAEKTLSTKGFDVEGFAKVMNAAGLSFDQLFERYVAKNVLNLFRQDHGYKEGTYIKVWNGKEDNEHLMEILALIDITQAGVKDTLYSELKGRYQAIA